MTRKCFRLANLACISLAAALWVGVPVHAAEQQPAAAPEAQTQPAAAAEAPAEPVKQAVGPVVSSQPYLYDFGSEIIKSSIAAGAEYLFLPSGAELPPLDKNGCIEGTAVHVLRSANIASLFLHSAKPDKESRAFVDAAKKNATTGSATLKDSAGNTVYRGELSQIKGRGNSTWSSEKKPYQIKLKEPFDLIQTGDPANASKTWILLANAFDATLLHNLIVYKTATAMGLDSPDCRPVDLYYDGEYRGNYLLCEKVETGAGRVNIDGNGFLLEMDNAYYQGEETWFIDSINTPFVVKAPEKCSKQQLAYIHNYMQEALDAAYNGGTHPVTGRNVWEYIDRTSLVKYYLLQEASKNADAFCSSTYFYLPSDGSPMKAGPVWDFDDSYGVREDVADPNGYRTVTGWMSVFLSLPDFRQEAKAYYRSTFNGILSKTAGGSTGDWWNIQYAAKMTDASAAMDHVLWQHLPQMYLTYLSRAENINYFKQFVSARRKWMNNEISKW